ncbi:hypothetical protein PV326_003142, partial [Microctonus aethiopoides]
MEENRVLLEMPAGWFLPSLNEYQDIYVNGEKERRRVSITKVFNGRHLERSDIAFIQSLTIGIQIDGFYRNFPDGVKSREKPKSLYFLALQVSRAISLGTAGALDAEVIDRSLEGRKSLSSFAEQKILWTFSINRAIVLRLYKLIAQYV